MSFQLRSSGGLCIVVPALQLRQEEREEGAAGRSCLDGGEDGGNVVDGAPLVLQYVEADAAIGVYCREPQE